MTNRSDILIIGAGAAGLMAAKELSQKGKGVTVLEAKPQAGGRISTLHNNGFLQPVEAGAEFIHGNLPVTLQLLKEAGIKYAKTKGEMLR
ncbi:MAG: FAD-dependent oxidoreductase, partial [Bacteroidota bacterium]|nr:FAD-dependent oxidoreductase [Bacteroidota bacterium]